MNSKKIINDLILGDEIIFVSEPEEIWEAINPNGDVIGEIKTTWEYYSFRCQLKTNVRKSGYSLRKKDDPTKIIMFSENGRIDRESIDIIGNDFTEWLDIMLY